jgi:hypothetical protein
MTSVFCIIQQHNPALIFVGRDHPSVAIPVIDEYQQNSKVQGYSWLIYFFLYNSEFVINPISLFNQKLHVYE